VNTPDPQGRRQAREAALQMLYQSEIGKAGAFESIATYWPAREPEAQLDAPLKEFANTLVRGALSRREEIDGLLVAHANNWRVERMGVIDRLVLRLGVYEMLAEAETPSKVIINEALELARRYSGEEAVGFVNGVLDSIRKELRRS
jgi:transcription antitermination protein NusB